MSTDKQFAAKAADIIGLYLNPPEKPLVISVDEKPSIQALERATGYVETDNGKVVRGFNRTYKRYGTFNLFAALQVATGELKTSKTTLKRREEFLQFMDQIVADPSPDQELHVILDNYCTTKNATLGSQKVPGCIFTSLPPPQVGLTKSKSVRHHIPQSFAWIEFKNIEELSRAIDAFIAAYNPTAKPFRWRKREVKGAQSCSIIINLCN